MPRGFFAGDGECVVDRSGAGAACGRGTKVDRAGGDEDGDRGDGSGFGSAGKTALLDGYAGRGGAAAGDHKNMNGPVWISMVPRELRPDAVDGPLAGMTFAIKDNIDLAGLPTTAGCPAYAYQPERSATVVERLMRAGAIPIGKTNLDQFATGLVGTRSPYGACSSVFDERYISGGSSSGSAVAVAQGLVDFSLGTDTAGSGRVTAAFNNLVGLKPTRGLLSTSGVVPACRTLDCVSVFALTCADAAAVLDVTAVYDDADSFSRPAPPSIKSHDSASIVIGVPRPDQLQFFGNESA